MGFTIFFLGLLAVLFEVGVFLLIRKFVSKRFSKAACELVCDLAKCTRFSCCKN
jgi:hypothetical protein